MSDTYQEELDAILESESMTQDEESRKYSLMTDEHEIITIQEKKVNVGEIGRILKGESNSTMLTFSIDRFYDGVDLYGKSISIICERPSLIKNDTFIEDVSNIEYSSSILKFSWVLSDKVTTKAGLISAAIQFTGTDETGSVYALKTSPFVLMVEETLEGTDMEVTVSENWFTSIESRLNTIENVAGLGDSQIITDYTQLNNLPTINGIKVTSAKSLDDYGIAAKNHTHSNYTTVNKVQEIVDEKLVGYVYVDKSGESDGEPVDLDEAVAISIGAYLNDNPVITDNLNGKKIYCFGDSLMTSKDAIDNNAKDEYGWIGGYPKAIKEMHPPAKVYNYGSPNGSLCSMTATALQSQGQNAPCIPNEMKNELSKLSQKDVDYVILNGCGNDIYVAGMQGKNLVTDLFGTPSKSIPTDAENDSTICGALELMFDWLTTNYPKTKIVFLSLPPIKQFYSVPTMYNEEIENKLIECFETICKKYGVTFVNLCNSILRRDLFLNSVFFYENDVHLKKEGYDAVANLINNVL